MQDYQDKLACSDLLSTSAPLSHLPAGIRDLLAGYMQKREFGFGRRLIRYGEPGDSLMLISRGHASVTLPLPNGSIQNLKTVARGDVVGEMALLTNEPRNADVEALDDVEVYLLSADAFEALTSRHPGISAVLTDILSERLGNSRIDALGQKVVEGYRIRECIGRGGMATVYAAVRVVDGQPVALKMMHHRLMYDSMALGRFQRESDIALSLKHPNIVRMDGRFEAYKTCFLVMELCDGPTLTEMTQGRDNHLAEEVVRQILGQLARALCFLHQRNLVHRDVKPSNVLVSRDGMVKLADFGLVRPLFEPRLTLTGYVLGTPTYMPPEQIAGKDVDGSGDIYALGCVIYELLTGHALFQERDLSGLIYSKLNFSPPSRSAIRQDMSDDLYEILRLSLQRAPEDRRLSLEKISAWAGPLDAGLLASCRRAENPSSDTLKTMPTDGC